MFKNLFKCIMYIGAVHVNGLCLYSAMRLTFWLKCSNFIASAALLLDHEKVQSVYLLRSGLNEDM